VVLFEPSFPHSYGLLHPHPSPFHSSALNSPITTKATYRYCVGIRWNVSSQISSLILASSPRQPRRCQLTSFFTSLSRACIISVIRLHTLYASTTSTDPTWDKNSSGYYGQVEVNLGIICASIVTLRPLWQKWGTYLQGKPQGGHAEPHQRNFPQYSSSLDHLKTGRENIRALDDSFNIELGATDSARSCTDSSRTRSQCTGAEYDQKPSGSVVQNGLT
jgi:hypothetical protein